MMFSRNAGRYKFKLQFYNQEDAGIDPAVPVTLFLHLSELFLLAPIVLPKLDWTFNNAANTVCLK